MKHLLRGPKDLSGIVKMLTELNYSEEKPFVVEIKKWEKSKSASQRGYLHVLFAAIAKETGNSIEVVKTEAKRKFLGTRMVEYKNHRTGEIRLTSVLRSTEQLTMKEMADLITQVYEWGVIDLDIAMPVPEEKWS